MFHDLHLYRTSSTLYLASCVSSCFIMKTPLQIRIFFTRTNVSYHRCHIQKRINMETQCIRHQIRIRLVQFQIVVVAASDSIELILPLNYHNVDCPATHLFFHTVVQHGLKSASIIHTPDQLVGHVFQFYNIKT